MSAVAGRLIRIVWIALIAALGVTAAWPDASDEDRSASFASRAHARELHGDVRLPSAAPLVGGTVVRYERFAAADAAALVHAAEIRTYPRVLPIPNAPQQPQPSSDPNAPQQPQASPYPYSPQHPPQSNIPQIPQSAHAPDAVPSIVPAVPESPQFAEAPQDQPVTYVVTAYYLNVREQPDKQSPIRGLLRQGDRVRVAGKTENGWLKLEDGLFIHGAYAEPAEPESEPVKNAGREVSIASASLSVRPEPAIYKPDPHEAVVSGPAPLSKKVKSTSGLTEDDIARLLEGTALEGHGLEEAILEIEEEYGINALFTIAVMKLESGNGKSKLAREKNNLFGLNATGGGNSKAYRFETKSDSVYKFGSLISKSYLAKGYSTIEKVGKKYCPANPKWPSLIESIMKRDHRKLSKSVGS